MRWVKIYESILNSRYSHKPEYLATMLRCIIRANIKPSSWEDIQLERGQFVISIRNFANEVGITPRSVRTVLKNLQNCNFLRAETTHRYTIITVCNYDTYQGLKNQSDTVSTQQRHSIDTAATQYRHSNDTVSTQDIEYKNKDKEKEKEKEIIDSCLCLSALSSGTTENGNTIVENFSDFENSEITENNPQNSDTTEEVEIEKEKGCAEKEKANFDDTATNTTAVVQVNQPAEKMPQTEKNAANTQLLLTYPTEDDKSTQIATRYDDIIAWFNNQVSNSGIRKIRCFNSDRETLLRQAIKQYGWEKVKQAVENATNSKFLTGKTDAGFVADFDFIFNKKKFPRILDGFYNKTDQSVKLVADIATNGVNTVMSACSLFDKDFFKKVNDNLKNGKPL